MRATASAEDIARGLIRERSRRSLAWFIRHAWHIVESNPYVHNWHMDAIAEHLAAVSTGQIQRLILNVPPASAKSLTVSVFWNAWHWLTKDPSDAFLYTSYDGSLTLRDAGKVRQILSSEWSKAWPNVRLSKGDAEGDFEICDARGKPHGGWRFSTSIGGPTTGRHPSIKVIDDPTKPREATAQNLEKTIRWYGGTFESRGRDPATVRTVLMMQRLAENDLAGHLLATEPHRWTHLNIPAEYSRKNAYATGIGSDPRTEEGESFFPSRFPVERLRSLSLAMGDDYPPQYNQNPIPPGGIVFTSDMLSRTAPAVPAGATWVLSVDATFKGLTSSDYVVMQVWALHHATMYLADSTRGQWDFVRTCSELEAMIARHPGLKVGAKLIEDKANGPAIMSYFKNKIAGFVPIPADNTTGGKLARARATLPFFAGGDVAILDTPETREWLPAWRREMLTFPRGTYDDQVDATTQAINYLAPFATRSEDFDRAAANWGLIARQLREGSR